jgi:integrase
LKISITEKAIKALRSPESGSRIYYDREVRGFGVRITANGVVSFVLNYSLGGRERRYTIANYPEKGVAWARDEANRLRGTIRDGVDPLEQRQQSYAEPTVADLANDYLDKHARKYKRASSIRNDQGLLRNIVLPRLGNFRVSTVGQRDIAKLHGGLKATPYHANRVLSLLSKMFSLAEEWKWRTDNPTKGIPRFPEDRRETWLSVEQLESLRRALADYVDQNAANAIRLLILTGAREDEVLSAQWSDFDLKRGRWTKPSHHTKQKKIEHIPLSQAALGVLNGMHHGRTGLYLFPGRFQGARVTLRRVWMQICRAAGLASEYQLQGKRRMLTRFRPTVRINDLRHTFASHLVSSGQSLHIVGRLLGHTQAATTQRYAHVADEALRTASNQFPDVFDALRDPDTVDSVSTRTLPFKRVVPRSR